jgi:hypothetical protein
MDSKLLEEAAARGVIADAQRAELEALQQETNITKQDERIKTVGSFNEIFVTIGVLLACWAVTGLLSVLVSNALLIAAFSLGLNVLVAEHFYRAGRFRLPIITAVLMAALSIGNYTEEMVSTFAHAGIAQVAAYAAALPVLGLAAHRYQLPFLMLPIAAAFTLAVTFSADLVPNALPLQLLLGACGLSILAFAIRMDLRDPMRTAKASDFAFWSYMIGSPLFVHSLFLSVLLDEQVIFGAFSWVLVALMALVVSFAGVLLNRRALILSTMAYVGYVIFSVLRHSPLNMASVSLITLLVIGLYIFTLGSRWAQLRRALFVRLPQWPWLKKLPVV